MTNIKKTVLTLSAIVLFATGSFAGTEKKATAVDSFTTNEMPVTVEYLGEDANYVVFQVTVTESENKTASLEVSDRSEGEIYAGKFNAAKTQTLKIEKRFDQELSFTVSIGNEKYSKSFVLMQTVVLNSIK
jgi:hypothetical protein